MTEIGRKGFSPTISGGRVRLRTLMICCSRRSQFAAPRLVALNFGCPSANSWGCSMTAICSKREQMPWAKSRHNACNCFSQTN
jgi:hypothetical protein